MSRIPLDVRALGRSHPAYRAYLARRRYMTGRAWRRLSQHVQCRAEGLCEACGDSLARLEVHHLTYERFGRESVADLQALCARCHTLAHQEHGAPSFREYALSLTDEEDS